MIQKNGCESKHESQKSLIKGALYSGNLGRNYWITSGMASMHPDKEVTLKQLAERIRSLRIAKGYTNYEYFAYEKGFSRSQFGRYERGEDIRYTSLVRVAKAFDMTLEEFFSEGFD